MKRFIIVIPFVAMILLAAHALRQGDFGLTALFVILAGLMFARQAWVRLVAICALFWGGYIWADATVQFISFRQAFDLPWHRLLAIMAGVVVFDGLALLTLAGQRAQDYFEKGRAHSVYRAAVAVLVVVGLSLARAKVSFPLLLADRYFPGWGWLEIALLALYAQWVCSLMLSPKGHRAVRPLIWGLFSLVFFGQLVLGLMGMDRMLMTGTLHLPVPALIAAGPVFRGSGFFMLILFGATVLLVGPAWCSHLCYIGAWDDAMSRLNTRPVSNPLYGKLSIVGRAGTLLLTVGTAWGLRIMGIPGQTAVLYAVFFGLVGVGVMLFVSRKAGIMAHCTTFCPMGLIANLAGKLSPWRLRIGENCTRCGVCFSRCRYNALDNFAVEQGKPAISCTLCGDCVSSCAHKQIGYRFPGLRPERARAVFIVLVVSLHAIFLGVARI